MSSKAELIRVLKTCARLMEIRGENPFRCRAYENGARALEGLQGEPAEWLAGDVLGGVKGIGKGMQDNIREFVETGAIGLHTELCAEIPEGVVSMLNIPGLGAKKIQKIWKELGIDSTEALEAAATDGTIAALPGFGAKTAEKIVAGIHMREQFAGRHRVEVATARAKQVVGALKKLREVRKIEVAGSVRRRRETVKDLDFVVVSTDAAAVMEAFVGLPDVMQVVAKGATKSSVVFYDGVPADLRVVAEEEFAPALNYFTGSKEHNTRMRGRAKKRGLRLNEYGLYPEGSETSLLCPTERTIYEHLGLAYVEPELREDMGEIEAAEAGELPKLIAPKDMKGLLHCHSTYSDGKSTLAQMAEAAKVAGYKYFGVCDHSKAASYAGGLKEADVERQHAEIERLNAAMKDSFRILKGIESDILVDGALDYEDEFLARFDFVVVSIHSRFTMGPREMTERIVRAISHPAASILAHPTGRLLLQREGYEIDYDEIFRVAAERRVAIEINANPRRLELDWRYLRQAKAAGCIFAINPDAHHTSAIEDVAYGIGVGRKGWLEADDVINTKTLAQFRKWLKERGQPGAQT